MTRSSLAWLFSGLVVAVSASLAQAQFGGFKPPKLPEVKPPKLPEVKPPKLPAVRPPKVTGITPPKVTGFRPPNLPDIRPPKLPEVKPPDLSKLDPVKAAQRELENARRSAMKNLRKLDPNTIFSNVQRSIEEFRGGVERKTGLKVNERTGDVDLRGHRAGRTLNDWMRKFAQGNEGRGEVEEFRFNVRTRKLELRVKARHQQRQNWGVLGKVVLYDCTQTARFSFDFRRSEADFNIDLGPLAPRITSKSIKALKDGDLLAAVEAAGPTAINKVVRFERKNDYDRVLREKRARHGERYVYLSSRRFVDWAGSKSIGKYAATGVVSGGAAVWPQIMRDAKEMARKEIPDIVAWLQRLGQRDARRMAEKLLTGQRPEWPYLKFEIVVIPHYAREVNPQTGLKTPWRQFNNLGFVLVFDPRLARR